MLTNVRNAIDGYCKYYDEALGTIHVNKMMRLAQEELTEENLKKLFREFFEDGWHEGIAAGEAVANGECLEDNLLDVMFESAWNHFNTGEN